MKVLKAGIHKLLTGEDCYLPYDVVTLEGAAEVAQDTAGRAHGAGRAFRLALDALVKALTA